MNITINDDGTINIPTDTVLKVLVARNKKGDIYDYQEEIYHGGDDATVIKEILTEPQEIYVERILQDIDQGEQYLVWSENGDLAQLATTENLLKNLK